jgi:hypothetical protein
LFSDSSCRAIGYSGMLWLVTVSLAGVARRRSDW